MASGRCPRTRRCCSCAEAGPISAGTLAIAPDLALLRLARHRFALILAALVLGGLGTLSVLTYLRARALIEQQTTSRTLPLTSDAVASGIEQELLQPVLASRLMADNKLLESSLSRDQDNSTVLRTLLQRIQQRTNAATAFLVSEATRQYHHSSGVIKTLSPDDPQDDWYQRFVSSGEQLELNIDRDTADPSRRTAFINVRVDDDAGKLLGVTGVGLDIRDLEQMLRRYETTYGVRILLVNSDGRILLASDQSSGQLQQQPLIGAESARILSASDLSLRLGSHGDDLYVRATRIPELDLSLLVLQEQSPEQAAFHQLLIQNLAAALLISVVLIILAQATLGRDQKQLETIARTDKLTGLLNRRQFEHSFADLSQRAERSGSSLAAVVMDIDHFKRVNDTHGHPVGDAVLRHVSHRIASQVRESDPLFRWGGEEFLLLLFGCDQRMALERLEAIRADLRAHPLERGQLQLPVTLSFGLTLHRPGESSAALVQRADAALYTAKREGRDRICSLDPGNDGNTP